ncbi:MAG: peptidyl-prolyl cis-trans isomerase [Nitrospinota bacterium]|nr:peptidyl-prolyl cis-trans isomerase [Nitrospinota bacterium]
MNNSLCFKITLFFLVASLLFPILVVSAKDKKDADRSKIVVATVNGFKITLADIDFRLQLLSSAVRLRVKKNKKKFLESIVRSELLFQEAERQGLASKEYVVRLISLSNRRILKDFFLKEKVYSDVGVSDDVLKKFFSVNKERFKRKESVTLSHIVLRTRKEAEDVLKFLKSGEIFSKIARSRSIFTPTRNSGGVLGTVERGSLSKKIEKIVFELPVGQVTKPVKTKLGWEILRVSEHITEKEAKFEDVKQNIRMFFVQSKHSERYRTLLKKLEKKSDTKIFLKNFK